MEEIQRQVIIVLRGMWKHRWLGVFVAWVVAAISLGALFFVKDKFEASARIYVNTASILKPLMQGMTVQPNDDERIKMLSRVLISRPNIETLIQSTGLDTGVSGKEEYERLVDQVSRVLEIRGGGRDNIYTLVYRDTHPDRAKKVVQLFSTMFIESGQGGKVGETDAAKQFIDEQISVYEKKLEDAEARLKEFRLKYLGMSPGEGAGFFTRLSEANTQLSRAQLELREAENSRDAFRRGLLSSEEATPNASGVNSGAASTANSASLTDIDGRLESMRRNLDVLLQRFTENHPDVIGSRRVLKELEEQRQQIIKTRPRESIGAPTMLNGARASEQLKVSLAAAEAGVASLRIRVAEYQMRYNQLKSSATLMPQLEAELAQLNRDYEVNKKNYESLVARRESANLSGAMQSVSGVADFRLVDPPRVSPQPVSPNRRLLMPLAFFIAIALGLATMFAMQGIRPTFYDRRALSEATGLPILGAVSLVTSPSQKATERKNMFLLVGSLGLLAVVYAVGYVLISILSARLA